MAERGKSSHRRFKQYREDLSEHRTEGSSRTAAAHAKTKRKHDRQRSFTDLLKIFIGMMASQRPKVAIALGTVTLATIFNLVPPYGAKIVFDYVLGSGNEPDSIMTFLGFPEEPRALLATVALLTILVVGISTALGITGRFLATLTTKRLQAKVRKDVFAHAVRLPLHRVYQLKSGGVASILREDAGGIAELVFSMLYNPWRAIVRLVGSLIILAMTDWRLLTGALLLLPTVFLTHKTWISRIRPLWRDIRASRQLIDGQATEAFGGMRVVRAFGRQRRETARFTQNNHLMIRQELLAWWWSRGIDTGWSLMIPTASALLLWFGGSRVLSGDVTTGELVMFLMYLAWLLEPLATLASSATAFQNSLAGLDRVQDLLEEPVEFAGASVGATRINPATVAGAISLRDVSFAYPGSERDVIHGVTLEAQAGQTIALVGTSGSGKTTLCNLIARFYDPTSGVIELDGVDLKKIDIESYRRLLGIVEQDIFLFDGSVAENISYGRRGATRAEVQEMAALANAAGFIEEFERGYDTVIGERGVRLSGGQRQRIAIARALLADPTLLILDEATSNLDTESERLIQESLQRLMHDRTCFVIAHRLSTITHADCIAVIEGGRLIESGTHAELMTRSGRYEAMVAMQLQDLAAAT